MGGGGVVRYSGVLVTPRYKDLFWVRNFGSEYFVSFFLNVDKKRTHLRVLSLISNNCIISVQCHYRENSIFTPVRCMMNLKKFVQA